jgi:hypothetical protein
MILSKFPTLNLILILIHVQSIIQNLFQQKCQFRLSVVLINK